MLVPLALLIGILHSIFGYRTETGFIRRSKRVTWGDPIPQKYRNAYDAVMYYAWIGYGDRCQYDLWWLVKILRFFEECVAQKDDLYCSGALITPTIVSTAAHCLATSSTSSKHWSSYTVQNVWEVITNVIVGFNSYWDMDTEYGILAKKFLVHPKYAHTKHYAFVTHDFGWIVLEKAYEFPSNNYKLAPLYNIDTLTKVYKIAQSQQWVCLFIGFGRMGKGMEAARSEVLRHAWMMMNDYEDTYESAKGRMERLNVTYFNYAELATWVYLRAFGNNYAYPQRGDSGSPLSCKNYNFGVTSTVIEPSNDRGEKIKPAPLASVASNAFTVFESSAEYRKLFEDGVRENIKRDKQPTFKPPFSSAFVHVQ